MTGAAGWKVSLLLPRAEAVLLQTDESLFAGLDPEPVVSCHEPDARDESIWLVELYLPDAPSPALIDRLLAATPSARREALAVAPLPGEDWVALSQAGLTPVRAGRFWVHAPDEATPPPAGAIALAIPATEAFGTGHHPTTRGCLLMIDHLSRRWRPRRPADIGAGTALLALAMGKRWRRAVMASDIDPVAVRVAARVARANRVRLGRRGPGLDLVIAAGLRHPRLRGSRRYDLIVANILAGPLVALAPDFTRALAPGGHILLAGLLDTQAQAVGAAYRNRGLVRSARLDAGDWPTLLLRKPGRYRKLSA